MTGLEELLERVVSAKEPDRALGAAICRHVAGNPVGYWYDLGGHWVTDSSGPTVTEYVDEILGLVHRFLPGWSLQLYEHPDAVYVTLYRLSDVTHFPDGGVERRISTPYFEATRLDDRHTALAICEAFLRALAARPK